MEHRMSIRIPTNQPATVKPLVGMAFRAELRDISFDGAFLTMAKRPQSLLGKHVRVRLNGGQWPDAKGVEIRAHVVRATTQGVGLEFDTCDEAINGYLEHVYAERLLRESTPRSLWH